MPKSIETSRYSQGHFGVQRGSNAGSRRVLLRQQADRQRPLLTVPCSPEEHGCHFHHPGDACDRAVPDWEKPVKFF